ncbi:hypothetical protein D9757_012139 [Collybiopsis confluens]|uniref:G domain-containing protein n=1 Tax=Collybiopsis confluens TaxID=2823264 RepID=A0A8H5GIB5_9AGAR|nr:hypothetical protein D9757_012139 [Collybiopsis confluens]
MTRNGWRQELTMRPDQSALSLNVPYSSTTLNRSFGDSTIFHEGDMGSTAELLEVCPRFRILVIGKSGAGKSSLINSAFDVQYANVSHDLPGISDIKQEIISEQNPLFVVHDSQGFAAGETQNFETVKRFIDERAKEPELKDRLHAIWFCMEIPTENGALFQKADENFLKLELHNVPVIIVFTKFDLLISKFEREATDILDENKLDHAVHQRAEKFFQETCVRPLKRIASSHVYVKVSSNVTDFCRWFNCSI